MSRLQQILKKLYPENLDEVTVAVENCFDGSGYKSEDRHWYKNLQLYVTYPDSFHDGDVADFRTLARQLDHIKDLGCNCVHVLPFLSSPMVDMGFDVSDYFLVREELGGGKALDQFLAEAEDKKIRVMMDIVLNHVSEEHRWFRQAVSGDEFYRDFFVCRDSKPAFIDTYTDEHGVWAKYMIGDKEVSIRIIFPEQTGEIPHFIEAEDANWYYHTFYPHQLDLNWYNYHVFVSFAKILVYWAKKGLSFRLDAIPFVSKDLEKGITESNDRVHDLIYALNLIVKEVNQESIFLVEANQPVEAVKKYFGTNRTESELAYHFPLMNALWTSLVSEDSSHIWQCLDEQGETPESADWITFLRNHDELTLEYATPEQRQIILKQLKGRGKEFRKGFGYSGRTYNFLKNDVHKTLMAYFLLASMPGNPAIIFGDEFAKEYSNTFMRRQTKWKRRRFADENIAHDTRDINRSPVMLGEDNKTDEAEFLVKEIGAFMKTRAELKAFYFDDFKQIEAPEGVFAGEYKKSKIQIYINLTDEVIEVEAEGKTMASVGEVDAKASKIRLKKYSGVWLKS